MKPTTTIRPAAVDAVLGRIRAALAEDRDVDVYLGSQLGLTRAERRELFRRIAVEFGERDPGLS
jgi:hypothetical protein